MTPYHWVGSHVEWISRKIPLIHWKAVNILVPKNDPQYIAYHGTRENVPRDPSGSSNIWSLNIFAKQDMVSGASDAADYRYMSSICWCISEEFCEKKHPVLLACSTMDKKVMLTTTTYLCQEKARCLMCMCVYYLLCQTTVASSVHCEYFEMESRLSVLVDDVCACVLFQIGASLRFHYPTIQQYGCNLFVAYSKFYSKKLGITYVSGTWNVLIGWHFCVLLDLWCYYVFKSTII